MVFANGSFKAVHKRFILVFSGSCGFRHLNLPSMLITKSRRQNKDGLLQNKTSPGTPDIRLVNHNEKTLHQITVAYIIILLHTT